MDLMRALCVLAVVFLNFAHQAPMLAKAAPTEVLAMAASLTVLVTESRVVFGGNRVNPVRVPVRVGRERMRPPETSSQTGAGAPDSAKMAIPSAQPTERNLGNQRMGICPWH